MLQLTDTNCGGEDEFLVLHCFISDSVLLFPLFGRLEQEKAAMLKRLKARGVTADQVVALRSTQVEEEMEELRRKNADLETQIYSIR